MADDIPDDRRRTQVPPMLMGLGKWTPYSLVACFLTGKELILLQSKLAHHLVAQQDLVRFSSVYASCLGKVETVGGLLPAEERVFMLQEEKLSLARVAVVTALSVAPRLAREAA